MSGKVILFQGDSITDCGRLREEEAANTGLGRGYPALLTARLRADRPAEDFQCFNRGVSGDRVVDLYARWKVHAINLAPDVLSLLIGVNDTWHEFANRNGVEVDRYGRFYRMLLDWTLEARPGIKMILIEPFVLEFGVVSAPWVAEIDERRKIVRELAREYRTAFVPAQDVFNAALRDAPADYWLIDGVHPTPAGHQRLADAWLKAAAGLF